MLNKFVKTFVRAIGACGAFASCGFVSYIGIGMEIWWLATMGIVGLTFTVYTEFLEN